MRLTAFRVGAATWVFTGLVHDILEFVLPGDPKVNEAMRASDIDVGPFALNAESLNRGVSLAMGWAMIVVGVLLWLIARTFQTDPDRARPFGFVALGGSVVAVTLAAIMIPGPPLVTFMVATIAFIVALATKTRATTDPPQRSAPTVGT